METSKKSIINRTTLTEGLRVGLKAFVVAYAFAFLLSLVINLSVIESIQDYLQGTLSAGVGFDFGLLMKVAAAILNVSVFNSAGTIQLGLLIFGMLPLLAFYIADRGDNKNEGMDAVGFSIYVVASLVFSALLMLLSYLTQGDILDMAINFVSWRNGLMTFIITLLIQIAIGMNYDVHRLPGIIATRWMVRLMLITCTIISTMGLVSLMWGYTQQLSLILLGILVLVPNLAVYTFFMMFGLSIEFNESLEKLMAFGGVELSFGALPVALRLTLLLAFILFGLFAVSRIEKKRYGDGLIGFVFIFPLLSYLLASCTIIDLGIVRGLMDIRLGINLLHAWLYPFVGTLMVGLLYYFAYRLYRQLRS